MSIYVSTVQNCHYVRLLLFFSFLFYSEYYLRFVFSKKTGLITGSLFRMLSCNHDDLVRPLANTGHPCPGPKFFFPPRLSPCFRLRRGAFQVFHGNRDSFRARFTVETRGNRICLALSAVILSRTILVLSASF